VIHGERTFAHNEDITDSLGDPLGEWPQYSRIQQFSLSHDLGPVTHLCLPNSSHRGSLHTGFKIELWHPGFTRPHGYPLQKRRGLINNNFVLVWHIHHAVVRSDDQSGFRA
jgi:hypothetical protein